MKVLFETCAVVLIRMTKQERVHVRAPLRVMRKPIAKILAHIARIVVRIIGGGANVDVHQYERAGLIGKTYERHVAAAHREKRDHGTHASILEQKGRHRAG